jgi:archaemetzincin
MSRPDKIIISPIGDIPDWIKSVVSEKMARVFGFQTQIIPLIDDISFAFDQKRLQYHSTRILEKLEQHAPDDCLKILGITQEDLFIPILTHVYGEAQLGGIASIISISRLIDYPKTITIDRGRSRIIKEAAHELGHTFDLRHCEDSQCIMHYCRKIEDVDKKSERFCRYCSILFNDAIKLLGF